MMTSFAHASSYFWNCGDGVGSQRFWAQGSQAGSLYYWNKGDGPGSKYYWLNGTEYGSKYYYLKKDGPWSSFAYQTGTGPGSYYFWNYGNGPGSRFFFRNGNQASSNGVITALCLQNLITHPLCSAIRNASHSPPSYCLQRPVLLLQQYNQMMQTVPKAEVCDEVDEL